MVEQTTLHNVLTCVIAVVIFIFQSLNYIISWIKNYVKHREKTIPVVTADTTISSDSQPNDNNTLEHFIRVHGLIQKHLDIPLIVAEDEPKVDGLTEHFQLSSSSINKEKNDLDQFVDHLIDDSYVARGLGLITATVGRPTDFYLYSKHDNDFKNIEIEIKGRSGEVGKITVLNRNPVTSEGPNSIFVDYSNDKDRLKVTYTPCAEGVHTLTLLKYGVSICRSPYYISVEKSATNNRSRIRLGTKKYKMVTKFGKGKYTPIETKDNNFPVIASSKDKYTPIETKDNNVPVLAPSKDKYTPIETKNNNIPVIASNKHAVESSNRPKYEETPIKMDVMSIVTKFESKSMNSKIMPQKRLSCIVERSSEGDLTDTSSTTFNEQSKIKTSNINDTDDNILNKCKSINRKYSSETNSQEKELDNTNAVKAEDDQKDKSDAHIKTNNDIIENKSLSSNLQELTINGTSTNTLKHEDSCKVEKHDKTSEINEVLKEQKNIDILIEQTEDQLLNSDYTDAESFNIQNEVSYFDDEDRKTVVVVENNANELESSSNDSIAHKITTSTQYDINTLPLANIITKITDSVCAACSKQVFSILSSFPKDLNIKHEKNTDEKRSIFETFLSQPIRININIDNVYETPNISAQICNSTHLDTAHNINSGHVDKTDTSIKDCTPNEIESLGNDSRELYHDINNADTELEIEENKNDKEIISTPEENKIDAISLIPSEHDVKKDEIYQGNNEQLDTIIMQKCSINEENIFTEPSIDLIEPNKCNETIDEESIKSSEESSYVLTTNDLFTINDIENINKAVNEDKLKIVNCKDGLDRNLELENNIIDDTVSTKEASNIIPLEERVCNERNHEQSTSNLYETDNDNFLQTTIQDEDQKLAIEKLIEPILRNYLKSNMIKKVLQLNLKKGLSKESDTQTFEKVDVNPLNELQEVTPDNNTLITDVNIENEGRQIVTNETPITQIKNHIVKNENVETISNNVEINNNILKFIEQIIKTNMASNSNNTETVAKTKINNIVHTVMHLNDQQKNCNNFDSNLEKDTCLQEDITDTTILNNVETVEEYETKHIELEKLDDIQTTNKTEVSSIETHNKEQIINTIKLQKLNEKFITNELEKMETKSETAISNDTGIILEKDKNIINDELDTNFNFPISNQSETIIEKECNETDEVSNLPEIPLSSENNTSIIESKTETEIVNNFKDFTVQNTCSQENRTETPNEIECDSIEKLNTVKNQNNSDVPTSEAIKNIVTPDIAETKITQNVNESNIKTLTLINTEPTAIESEFQNTINANLNETKKISDEQTHTSGIENSQYDDKTNDAELVTIEKETRIKLPSLNVREIIIIEKPNLKDERTTSGELISHSISTVKIELDTSNTRTSNATILLSINKSNILVQENTSTLRILDQIETDVLKNTNQVNILQVQLNDNDTKNETIQIDTLTENTQTNTSNNPNTLMENLEQTNKTKEHTISSDMQIAKVQNSPEMKETLRDATSTNVSTRPIQNPKNDEIVNIKITENEVPEVSVINVLDVEKEVISLLEPTEHSKEEDNQYKPTTINAIDTSISSWAEQLNEATINSAITTTIIDNCPTKLMEKIKQNEKDNITKNIIETKTHNLLCNSIADTPKKEITEEDTKNTTENLPCDKTIVTPIEEKIEKESVQENQTINPESDFIDVAVTEPQVEIKDNLSEKISETIILTEPVDGEKEIAPENVIIEEASTTPTTEKTEVNKANTNISQCIETAFTAIEENSEVDTENATGNLECNETTVIPVKENAENELVLQEQRITLKSNSIEVAVTESHAIVQENISESITQTNILLESNESKNENDPENIIVHDPLTTLTETTEIGTESTTDNIQCKETAVSKIKENLKVENQNANDNLSCNEPTMKSIEENVRKESVQKDQTVTIENDCKEVAVTESQELVQESISENITKTEILTISTEGEKKIITENVIVDKTSSTPTTETTKKCTISNLSCDEIAATSIKENSEIDNQNKTDILPCDETIIIPIEENSEVDKENITEKIDFDETAVTSIEKTVEKESVQEAQISSISGPTGDVAANESHAAVQETKSENITHNKILTKLTECEKEIKSQNFIVDNNSTTPKTEQTEVNKENTANNLAADETEVKSIQVNSDVYTETITSNLVCNINAVIPVEDIKNESVKQIQTTTTRSDLKKVAVSEPQTVINGNSSENITNTYILTELTETKTENTTENIIVPETSNTPSTVSTKENNEDTTNNLPSNEKTDTPIEENSEKDNITDNLPSDETTAPPIKENVEKESLTQEQSITPVIITEPQTVVKDNVSETITQTNILSELTEGEKETEPEKTIIHGTSVILIEDEADNESELQEQKMISPDDSTKVTVNESQEKIQESISENVTQNNTLIESIEGNIEIELEMVIVDEALSTPITETKENKEDTTGNLPCGENVVTLIEENSKVVKENTTDKITNYETSESTIKENVEKESVIQKQSITPEIDCTGVILTEPQTVVKDNVSETIIQTNILSELTEGEKETEPEKIIIHGTSVILIEDKADNESEPQEQKMISPDDSTEITVNESQEEVQESISENVTQNNTLIESTEDDKEIASETVIIDGTSNTLATETIKENEENTTSYSLSNENAVTPTEDTSGVDKENTTDKILCDKPAVTSLEENVGQETVHEEQIMTLENGCKEVTVTESPESPEKLQESLTKNIIETNILSELTEGEKETEPKKTIVHETLGMQIEDDAVEESEQKERTMTLQSDSTEVIVNESQEEVQQSISENVTKTNILTESTEDDKKIASKTVIVDETLTTSTTEKTKENNEDTNGNLPCDKNAVTVIKENSEVDKENTTDRITNDETAQSIIKESVAPEQLMTPENGCNEVVLTESQNVLIDKTSNILTTENTKENNEDTTSNLPCNKITSTPTQENIAVDKENINDKIECGATSDTSIEDTSEVDKKNSTDNIPCVEPAVTFTEEMVGKVSVQEERTTTLAEDCKGVSVTESQEDLQESISENKIQTNILNELSEIEKETEPDKTIVHETLTPPPTKTTKVNYENITSNLPCDETSVIRVEDPEQEQTMISPDDSTEVTVNESQEVVQQSISENITKTNILIESTEGNKEIAPITDIVEETLTTSTAETTKDNKENTTGKLICDENVVVPSEENSKVEKENTTDNFPCNEPVVMPIEEKESLQEEQMMILESNSIGVIEPQVTVKHNLSENITETYNLTVLTEGEKECVLENKIVHEILNTLIKETTEVEKENTTDNNPCDKTAVSPKDEESEVTKEYISDKCLCYEAAVKPIEENLRKKSIQEEQIMMILESDSTGVAVTELGIVVKDNLLGELTETKILNELTNSEKEITSENVIVGDTSNTPTTETTKENEENTTGNLPCNVNEVTPIRKNIEKESIQENKTITPESGFIGVSVTEPQVEVVKDNLSEKISETIILTEPVDGEKEITPENVIIDEASTTPTTEINKGDTNGNLPIEENIGKKDQTMATESGSTGVAVTEPQALVQESILENITQTNILNVLTEGEKENGLENIIVHEISTTLITETIEVEKDSITDNFPCDETTVSPKDEKLEVDKENTTDESPCYETAVTSVEENEGKESVQEEQTITLESHSTGVAITESMIVVKHKLSENITDTKILTASTESKNDFVSENVIVDETLTTPTRETTKENEENTTGNLPYNEIPATPIEENLEVDEKIECGETSVTQIKKNVVKKSAIQEESMTPESNCTQGLLAEAQTVVKDNVLENITLTNILTESTEGEKNIATENIIGDETSNTLTTETTKVNKEYLAGNLPFDDNAVNEQSNFKTIDNAIEEKNSKLNKVNITDNLQFDETAVMSIEENIRKVSIQEEQTMTLIHGCKGVSVTESQLELPESISENKKITNILTESTESEKETEPEKTMVHETSNTPPTETINVNKEDITGNLLCNESLVMWIEENVEKEPEQQEQTMILPDDSTEITVNESQEEVQESISENVTQNNTLIESTEGDIEIALEMVIIDETLSTPITETTKENKEDITSNLPCNENVVPLIGENIGKESVQENQIINPESGYISVAVTEPQVEVKDNLSEKISETRILTEPVDGEKEIAPEDVIIGETSATPTTETTEINKENSNILQCVETAFTTIKKNSEIDKENTTVNLEFDETTVTPVKENVEKEPEEQEYMVISPGDSTEVTVNESQEEEQESISENVPQNNTLIESTEGNIEIELETVIVDEALFTPITETKENKEDTTGKLPCGENVVTPIEENLEVVKEKKTDNFPCNEPVVMPIEEKESLQEEQMMILESNSIGLIEPQVAAKDNLSENITETVILTALTGIENDFTSENVIANEISSTPTETTKVNREDSAGNLPFNDNAVKVIEEKNSELDKINITDNLEFDETAVENKSLALNSSLTCLSYVPKYHSPDEPISVVSIEDHSELDKNKLSEDCTLIDTLPISDNKSLNDITDVLPTETSLINTSLTDSESERCEHDFTSDNLTNKKKKLIVADELKCIKLEEKNKSISNTQSIIHSDECSTEESEEDNEVDENCNTGFIDIITNIENECESNYIPLEPSNSSTTPNNVEIKHNDDSNSITSYCKDNTEDVEDRHLNITTSLVSDRIETEISDVPNDFTKFGESSKIFHPENENNSQEKSFGIQKLEMSVHRMKTSNDDYFEKTFVQLEQTEKISVDKTISENENKSTEDDKLYTVNESDLNAILCASSLQEALTLLDSKIKFKFKHNTKKTSSKKNSTVHKSNVQTPTSSSSSKNTNYTEAQNFFKTIEKKSKK